MARTDVLTTGNRIRRQLGSGHRQEIFQLQAALSAVTPSVVATAPLPASVRAGSLLVVESELMRVTSVAPTTNTATVVRGYLGSEAATHAVTELVDINPRFSMLDITDAMQSEIDAWVPHIYNVISATFTVATSARTLELPAAWSSLLGIIDVMQSDASGDITSWPKVAVKLIRGRSADFTGAPTSGVLLRFVEPIRTGEVYVVAAMPFDTTLLTTTADLVTDVGLGLTQLDVLELGVKRRLLLQGDNGRTARQPQDEARRAEETPLGSLMSIHQLQLALYTRRRSEEAARLQRLYPIKQT